MKCGKKAKAIILTKHEKEYDKTTGKTKRYGMVRVMQHRIGFRRNCENTSQIKALIESDEKDENEVLL